MIEVQGFSIVYEKNPEIEIGIPASYDHNRNIVKINRYSDEDILRTLDHEFLHAVLCRVVNYETSKKLDTSPLGENLLAWIYGKKKDCNFLEKAKTALWEHKRKKDRLAEKLKNDNTQKSLEDFGEFDEKEADS